MYCTFQIKSLFSLCVAEACYEFAAAHLRVIVPAGNTAHLEKMSQRWQAVGNTVRFNRPKI